MTFSPQSLSHIEAKLKKLQIEQTTNESPQELSSLPLLRVHIVIIDGKITVLNDKILWKFLRLLVTYRYRFRVIWIWLWNGISGVWLRWRIWIAHFKHHSTTKHQTIYFVFPFGFLIAIPQ
jgi:hypothetical protein